MVWKEAGEGSSTWGLIPKNSALKAVQPTRETAFSGMQMGEILHISDNAELRESLYKLCVGIPGLHGRSVWGKYSSWPHMTGFGYISLWPWMPFQGQDSEAAEGVGQGMLRALGRRGSHQGIPSTHHTIYNCYHCGDVYYSSKGPHAIGGPWDFWGNS